MSEHLSFRSLSALADGELSGTELVQVNEHLAACSACTSSALAQSLLKSATARAGQRYTPPPGLQERLVRLASQEASRPEVSLSGPRARPASRFASFGWAATAALLLVSVTFFVVERNARRNSAEYASLVTEICDQHIATLAGNGPPEVISSDRHTVKPWFQGKIPFSFNLPRTLPNDTTLDGANLTYLRNQPTAQLLFSIGKHRVSVFVQQRRGANDWSKSLTERSGFHVTGFRTEDLAVVAVSDVEAARLSDLVQRIAQAQTGAEAPVK